MAQTRCKSCDSTEVYKRQDGDELVCYKCGTVVEWSSLINTTEFNADGQAMGQYVSATSNRAFGMGGRSNRSSREVTIRNGKREIARIAPLVNINPRSSFTEQAMRLFMLASSGKMIQGRKTSSVCAVCLYIICRWEKSPQLLIDFSDALQVNVFVLGSIFMKLKTALKVNTVPLIDPSLYIHRFAQALEFGDERNAVVTTALRLVKRMRRDWITTGRRPTGVCAAALLIAARSHNFCRTQKEVMSVVRVCDATLRNRLHEFGATQAAQLTQDEFDDLAECTNDFDVAEDGTSLVEDELVAHDPPAFTRNRLEDQQKLKLLEDGDVSATSSAAAADAGRLASTGAADGAKGSSATAAETAIVTKGKSTSSAALTKPGKKGRKRRKSKKSPRVRPWARKHAEMDRMYAELSAELSAEMQEGIRLDMVASPPCPGGAASKEPEATATATATAESGTPQITSGVAAGATADGSSPAAATAENALVQRPAASGGGEGTRTEGEAGSGASQAKDATATAAAAAAAAALVPSSAAASSGTAAGAGGAQSTGASSSSSSSSSSLVAAAAPAKKTREQMMADHNNDIDSAMKVFTEKEIDGMMLSDAEVLKKKRIWESMNADWEKKQIDKALEEATCGPVKRRKRRKRGPQTSSSALAATQIVLEQKKISKKINYSLLKDIFDKDSDDEDDEDE